MNNLLFLLNDVIIGTQDGFCSESALIWQTVGIILLVFKIVIPILLIIFGIMDLGKAVVSSKDDEVKKSVKSLAMRAVAGIIIFFIPSIVSLMLGVVAGFSELKDDYKICQSCLTSPNGSCDNYVHHDSLDD